MDDTSKTSRMYIYMYMYINIMVHEVVIDRRKHLPIC